MNQISSVDETVVKILNYKGIESLEVAKYRTGPGCSKLTTLLTFH